MSSFADVRELARQQLFQGVVARSVHAERMTMSLIELEPGAVVPEHRHAQEQLGILLTGSMTFRIGEETQMLRPGGTWTIGAGVPHQVQAGVDGAVAFEVFSPVRDDWDRLERREPSRPGWPPAS